MGPLSCEKSVLRYFEDISQSGIEILLVGIKSQ